MNKRLLGVWGAAAFGAAVVFSVMAQDEVVDEGVAVEPVPAAEAEPEAVAEPTAAKVIPRPAEIMPLAAKSLLLDLTEAGRTLVAVGDRGTILLSNDGATWTQSPSPVRSALTAVAFGDASHGCAVGHDAVILCTADGGKTWGQRNFQPELEKPFLDVIFVDAQRAYAVGAYGLFYGTADGGGTWAEVSADAVRADEVHLNGIARLANGDLLIAGESGMLALSKDAGATWEKLESPYESSLFGALPVGDKGAMIYGLRGNVYVTADVGEDDWTKLEANSLASMFGGASLPGGEQVMVGLNGVILIANAAGTVRALKTDAGTPLSSALVRDGGLLVVGESGVQSVVLK